MPLKKREVIAEEVVELLAEQQDAALRAWLAEARRANVLLWSLRETLDGLCKRLVTETKPSGTPLEIASGLAHLQQAERWFDDLMNEQAQALGRKDN